ncbi:hypothetical protein BH11BAC3_BH11BAC3_22380 [soil metagenome]
MSVNWPVIVIVAILAIALLVFLIKRNMKDEKRFEKELNEDFPKISNESADTDPEELPK